MKMRNVVMLGSLLVAAEAQSIPAITQLNTFPGEITQIATDSRGQIYLIGLTTSVNFPVTPNALTTVIPGDGFYPQGFLVKLDASGADILYATYLPGLIPDRIAVDPSGFMYVLGEHYEQAPEDFVLCFPFSFPFPISPNAAQTTPSFPETSVLAKFGPSGDLVYGTFVGGLTSPDNGPPYPLGSQAGAIAVDATGAALICSSTLGSDLPVGPTSYQRKPGGGWDAYIVRVSPDGTAFENATYLGGAGDEFCQDMKLDAAGNIYVFGPTTSRFFPVTPGAYQANTPAVAETLDYASNLYVASLDASLSNLRWSALLAGSVAYAISLDSAGDLLAFGETPPDPFGMVAGGFTCCVTQSFAAALSPDGTQLLWSQIFADTGIFGQGPAVDSQGNIYFGGASFPEDPTLNAGAMPNAAALTRFNASSAILTYLGSLPGPGASSSTPPVPVAYPVDAGKLLLAGSTGGWDGEAMLYAADFSAERLPLVTQAGSAVRLSPSQISPGELIQIRGLALGPANAIQYDPSVGPSTTLGQTTVFFDGVAAPLVSVSNTSVLALAPATLAPDGSTNLVLQDDGVSSDPRAVPVVAADPALLTTSGIGTGQADALNADGTPNSPQNPAQKGSNIRLFVSGLGAVGSALNLSALSATMDGSPAAVVALAPAANRLPGYFQLDATIPNGVPESDFVLVQIQVNGTPSQPGVTVAVQ
jgi:uncharacterized protein (TIGR03437 family)